MKGMQSLLAAGLLFILLGLPGCRSAKEGPIRILCMGDSITESRYGSYPLHLREQLRAHFPAAMLLTAARPGNSSGEYLAYLEESRIVERCRPDIVILMLGTNDARLDSDRTELAAYTANLRRILGLVAETRSWRGRAPRVLLATVPPILNVEHRVFDRSSSRRIASEINPAIRELAKRKRLTLVDIEALFLAEPRLISGIHPLQPGYQRMAREFFLALKPLLAAF